MLQKTINKISLVCNNITSFTTNKGTYIGSTKAGRRFNELQLHNPEKKHLYHKVQKIQSFIQVLKTSNSINLNFNHL